MLHNLYPVQKIIALFLVIISLFTSCCAGPKKVQNTVLGKETAIVSEVNEVNQVTATTVTDIEGNDYPVVAIGSQLWMAANLKVSQYNNGTPIQSYSGGGFLKPVEKGMFTYYNKEIANQEQFGKLYNYHVVAEDCLCPEGWVVPTEEDWQALFKNKGEEKLELPLGGYMNPQGIPPYTELNTTGYWWTSTSVGRNTVATYELHLDKPNLLRNSANEGSFLSVRCIKKHK